MVRLVHALAITVPLAALAAAPGWAQSACPGGYRYQSAQGNCVSIVAPTCPRGFHANANRTQCIDDTTQRTRDPSCPTGYRFRVDGNRGQCYSERPASCPSGQRIDTRSGHCVAPRH